MALLNYTTQVAVSKTVGGVIGILTTHGARAILPEVGDQGLMTGLSFEVLAAEPERACRLSADWRAVLRVMERDRRVAWSILKDRIEAQMALVAVNLATMEQVFLPYTILPDGRTVYERLREQRFALPLAREGA